MPSKKPSRFRRVFKVAMILLFAGVVVIAVAAGWIAYQVRTMAFLGPMPSCEAETAHLGGAWGVAEVGVELATTPESRERGLMFREELPPGEGMLFIYPSPHSAVFWMRNTPIPLDILFFDNQGNLRHVHFNAQPFDETPIPGGDEIRYVLEVPAGDTKRLAIGLRTAIRHPALDQSVVRWTC